VLTERTLVVVVVVIAGAVVVGLSFRLFAVGQLVGCGVGVRLVVLRLEVAG